MAKKYKKVGSWWGTPPLITESAKYGKSLNIRHKRGEVYCTRCKGWHNLNSSIANEHCEFTRYREGL